MGCIQRSIFFAFWQGVILALMLLGGIVAWGAGSSHEVVERDGVITIRIIIDKNAEPKIKELEGTAMLRAHRQLRKMFRDLPMRFSVPISVTRADLDVDTDVYFYEINVRRKDVEDCIAQSKSDELNAITSSVETVDHKTSNREDARVAAEDSPGHELKVTNSVVVADMREFRHAEGSSAVTENATNTLKSSSPCSGGVTNSCGFIQSESTGSTFQVVDLKPIKAEEIVQAVQIETNALDAVDVRHNEEETAEGAVSVLF